MSSYHWESSGRPLFVKTVYVNGSRHAILSKKDPFIQYEMRRLKKSSRSESSLSFSSSYSNSTVTNGSRGSDSEISFEIAKCQKSYSIDNFSDLQSCLIKLQFSNIRELKHAKPNENRNIYGAKEDESLRLRPRRKRKKKKYYSGSKKLDEELEFYKKTDDKGNKICDVEWNSNNDQERKNSIFEKEGATTARLGTDYGCQKNWKKVSNSADKNKITNSEKNINVLGETLYGLVMKTKPKGKTFIGNYYEPVNVGTCESYWNNYLGGSYNTSLAERVVQWIDLAKKLKKEEPQLAINGESPPKSFLKKNYEKTIDEYDDRNIENKSNQNFKYECEINNQNDSSDNDGTVQSETSTNDRNITFSIIHKSEKGKIAVKTANNQEEPNLIIGDIEQNNTTNLAKTSMAIKTDSNSTEFLLLQRESVNQFEISIFNNLKSDDFDAKGKNLNLNEKSSCEKKHLKCHNDKDNENLNEDDNKKEKNFKTKLFDVAGKQTKSVELSKRHFSREKNNQSEDKTKFQKNVAEIKKFENQHIWVNGSADDDCISINKINFTKHLPNSQFYDGNDVTSLKKTENSWELEKNLEKPQLHIFIPSLYHKELSECESVSPESSSFFN